ncbi:hypothetical protein MLD38_006767 [Melastoma candidum]|uniref:Uncharacterized protein n=1 Tax=Melastoma candidum TaxID=119954 RepID=A0ACB9RNY8_9MYRT|nr:hypothetical protein MLD38_006767 [Melastoma candidum]
MITVRAARIKYEEGVLAIGSCGVRWSGVWSTQGPCIIHISMRTLRYKHHPSSRSIWAEVKKSQNLFHEYWYCRGAVLTLRCWYKNDERGTIRKGNIWGLPLFWRDDKSEMLQPWADIVEGGGHKERQARETSL